MKANIFTMILGFSLFITACTEADDILTYHNLVNESEHNINVLSYSYKGSCDSLSLPIEAEKEWQFLETAIGPNPFGNQDYIMVIFDDSIKIKHSHEEIQPASRSLIFSSKWTGGKVNETLYRYKYIFTNADYQEALEYNRSK